MAFNRIELEKIEHILDAFIVRRLPPKKYANEIAHEYSIEKNNIFIKTIRTPANRPRKVDPISKIKYIQKTGEWKLYWVRYNDKWEEYNGDLKPTNLEGCIHIIERDKYGVFWG